MTTQLPLREQYECCPLCGEHNQSLLGSVNCTTHGLWHEPLPGTLEWMQCKSCSHVYTGYYWTPDGLAELLKNSNAHQIAGETGSFDAKRQIWSPVVEKALSLLGGYRGLIRDPSPLWVDVGCGDGALVMTANDYGFRSLGLDARSCTVDRLQSLGFNAVQGDFMSLDFKISIDILSMMDVLEHMPFPLGAIRKASTLLRAGGMFVISLPELGCSSWRALDAANANPYWGEIEHHHNFSRQRLTRLLLENGFEVVDYAIPFRYKASMEIYAIRIEP